MLKKNCHQVLGSQKSKLTPPELVFQTAGAINPPPYKDRVKKIKDCHGTSEKSAILSRARVGSEKVCGDITIRVSQDTDPPGPGQEGYKYSTGLRKYSLEPSTLPALVSW